MSQDLSFIKKELSTCEEFTSPFDIDIESHVKYITLKDRQEYFHTGGKYIGMIDNKIILKTQKNKIYVPLTIQNPDGTILYKTRLFVMDDIVVPSKKRDEYQSIINAQQSIIETMTTTIATLSEKNNDYKETQVKYERVIQQFINERKS